MPTTIKATFTRAEAKTKALKLWEDRLRILKSYKKGGATQRVLLGQVDEEARQLFSITLKGVK